MTPLERTKPEIIKANRKRRIATGAGVSVQEVNRLLNQFEQTQKMMKQFSKGGMAKMMRGMKGMLPGMRVSLPPHRRRRLLARDFGVASAEAKSALAIRRNSGAVYYRGPITCGPHAHCFSHAPRTMFGYSGLPRLPL